MVFPCRKRLLFQIKRATGSTNEQSFTCSALLCSALLCSALLLVYGACFILVNPFLQAFSRFWGKQNRSSAGAKLRYQHGKSVDGFPQTDCSWLTQWVPVALRRRLAPGLPIAFIDVFSILYFPKIARERRRFL